MASPLHAAVWLDQQEARVFHVDLDGFDEAKLSSPQHHVHRHPKGPGEPHEHPDDAARFFDAVALALASAGEVLVMGPSTAKLHLLRRLHEKHPALAAKVVGVETVDHPTDPQLVAYAKKYFNVSDLRVR